MAESTTQSDTMQLTPIMEDFVFGGIEADDTRLLAELRRRGTGLRHRYTIAPRDPRPGEAVQLTVYAGPDLAIDRITAYLTTDGTRPVGAQGVPSNGVAIELYLVDTQWEPALWDYIGIWQGTIPPQVDGTFVDYLIQGWRSYDENFAVWCSEPNLDGTIERPTRYGYTVDNIASPPWARDAMVYQIFVDRFTGITDRWLSTDELNSFTGGTLNGVREHLDYIADLGITAIWLSPIFTATSYHGYDTVDYYAIDPRFGTKDDLQQLVQAAHARKIRVILDFVANHTGPTFYPFVEAQAGDDTYRKWFTFDEAYKHGYRTFFDVATMPQLATDASAVRGYLCTAAAYWLTEFDVDGYRLDYAAGPSHAFWSEFRATCKRAKADCWLFGEATLAGADLRSYQGRLDGCLDFTFCRQIRRLCATAASQITLGAFLTHLSRAHHFFGAEFLLPTFIDNHDMNRFLWVVGNDQRELRLALALLFAFGATPILYYGTEIGLSQPRTKGPWREEARHPMVWEDAQQDHALLAFCKRWIAARRQHPALRHGTITIKWLDELQQCALVERQTENDRVLIAINLSEQTQSIPLPTDDTDGSRAQLLQIEARMVVLWNNQYSR